MRSLGAAILLGVAVSCAGPRPGLADWDAETCNAAVGAARVRAQALPKDDLSRRFAEHDLNTALTEFAAGDTDECEALVERADDTIATHRYVLRPGEVLDGYGPDPPR